MLGCVKNFKTIASSSISSKQRAGSTNPGRSNIWFLMKTRIVFGVRYASSEFKFNPITPLLLPGRGLTFTRTEAIVNVIEDGASPLVTCTAPFGLYCGTLQVGLAVPRLETITVACAIPPVARITIVDSVSIIG